MSGTWDPCCSLDYCCVLPAFKFYPICRGALLPAPHGVAACTAQTNKLSASLSRSSPMGKVDLPCPSAPHHPRPSAHQVTGKTEQQEAPCAPLCTSFIPGICKAREPAHGAAGLEHLPASAWEVLSSKCWVAEHREPPWLSQPRLLGAVEAVPPRAGGIALIFEGPGVRWPAGWGQVWDPLPRNPVLHSRGLGVDLWEVEDLRLLTRALLANASPSMQWGKQRFPPAHSCSTPLGEG